MKVVIDIPKDFEGDYIADKFKDFFSRVIADIDCNGMCGRYEKEIAEMFLKAFDDSEEKISCRCDNITANMNKAKVDSLEIIARMLDDKPYYELKYRLVGKKDYSIGYSSCDLKSVLSDIDTYFEIVENNDKHTNADRIRNMSDNELADWLNNMCDFEKNGEPYKSIYNLDTYEDEEVHKSYGDLLNWLQTEAE